MVSFEEAKKIKEKHRFDILSENHVIGVSTVLLDEKKDDWGIAVYTDTQNFRFNEIEGIPLIIVPFLGPYPFKKQLGIEHDVWRRERLRPCVGGIAISHYKSRGYGTLGFWVKDRTTNEPLLLSCWHVIANEGDCKYGDPILQPPACLGGEHPQDTIAYLHKWIDIEMIGEDIGDAKENLKSSNNPPTNVIDGAVALAASDDVVAKTWFEGNKPEGIKETTKKDIGSIMVKSGATTGVTKSRIVSIDMDVFVDYGKELGYALFIDGTLFQGVPPWGGVGLGNSLKVASDLLNFTL